MIESSTYRPLPGPFIALGSLPAFSFTGLVIAGLFLFMEQEAAYNCSDVLANVCRASWLTSRLSIFDCDLLARSPLARLLDTPLTVYAACYYLVVLGLAIALLTSRPRSAVWNAIEWALAWFAVGGGAVTIFLLGYSIVEFHALCQICLVFYFINGGICAATWLLIGSRQRKRRRWVGELPLYDGFKPPGDRSIALFFALVALFAASAVATYSYRSWDKHSKANAGSKCQQYETGNFSTPLRLGSASSKHPQILFVDPACTSCKEEWSELRNNEWSDAQMNTSTMALEVYLWPQDSLCDPDGSEILSLYSSQKYGSCQASKALWCVAKRRPDIWPTYLDRLFDLQGSQVTHEKLMDTAREIGFSEKEVLELAKCSHEPATLGAIINHREVGEAWLGVTGTPWRGVCIGERVQELPRDPEARSLSLQRIQRHEGL